MNDEGFLSRWSRLKTGAEVDAPAAPVVLAADAPALPAEPEALAAPPTLADAAALTPASDFSGFVARNVDAAVRRLAMKTLFADPHFQGHDGLDIYMADFNVPSPVSDSMLAQLTHSKGVFATLEEAIAKVDALLAAADPAPPAMAITPEALPSGTATPAMPPTMPPTPAPDQENA